MGAPEAHTSLALLSSGYAVRHLSRAMPAACLFAACKALAVSVHLDLFIHVWDCLGVIACVSFVGSRV